MVSTTDSDRIEVIDDQMVSVLKRKSSVERVAMALDAHHKMRLMLTAHFQSRNPAWSEAEVAAAVARKLLGEALWNSIPREGDSGTSQQLV